ncbi:hypothetical protein [Dysgonomonas macrotermitis]|uniref:Uncharacterized protein n=1 Tax=Dysgonomonas macrotermitis TaxID=1346286 RepID=A0A1M5IDN0_9BACT|nr:hypothetical protein [Dysgonomonas macrotermitis]SHG26351.1 hypothetical protein SAMN05444362_11943 [Dysgonomonas macrotermitis]
MKILYSKHFPPKGFAAINLFGIIIGRKEYGSLTKYEINHEKIHTSQIIELLWIFFYLLYGMEWLIRIVQYRHPLKAYYNISFEREAYHNDKDLDYLKNRPWYSFINYYRQPNDGKD